MTFGSNLCSCPAAGMCKFRCWVSKPSDLNWVAHHAREDCLYYEALRRHDPPLVHEAPRPVLVGPHFKNTQRHPEKPLTGEQRRTKRKREERDERAVLALKATYKKRSDRANRKVWSGLSSHAEKQRLQERRNELEKLERRKGSAALRTLLKDILPQAHHATSPPHATSPE